MASVYLSNGADVTIDEYIYEETSPGLGYPTWIYTMWLPMLSLAVIFRVLEPVIRGSGKGR